MGIHEALQPDLVAALLLGFPQNWVSQIVEYALGVKRPFSEQLLEAWDILGATLETAFATYCEHGKHYRINPRMNFCGKVIDDLTNINPYQLESGNAIGNVHAKFSTHTGGHPHSGVLGLLPNTDTLDLF